MNIAAILKEIGDKLQAAKATDKQTKFKDLKSYIGTRYDFIGLSVPAQRAVFKKGFSWSNVGLAEECRIWNEVWKNSGVYEVMSQALYFFLLNRKSLKDEVLWKIVKDWTIKVDNWAHSDGLSDLYSALLEKNPAMVYLSILKWNKSVNPWERRQSLVSLLEYNKKREQILPVEKLFPLVKNLLHDTDIFVQKGVGWTLREIGNAYPKETLEFLIAHHASISGIAFGAAIEKLDEEKKLLLKNLRKEKRKSKKEV